MLHVIGAGGAFPESQIDNAFLGEINPALQSSAVITQGFIQSRFSTLPLDYIRSTANKDVFGVPEVAHESPTDLGVRAAEAAIARAGITKEEIGLLLAESATPWETTPAEASRIGMKLNLKIPAYDVFGGGAALPFVLNLLNDWKEERMPDYVLFVSSNAMTQRVNYAEGDAGYYFGDGAGAVVFSCKAPSKSGQAFLSLQSVYFDMQPSDSLRLGIYDSIEVNRCATIDTIDAQSNVTMDKLISMSEGLSIDQVKFVGTQFDPAQLGDFCVRMRIAGDNHWSNIGVRGCCLGASVISVIAEQWEKVLPEDKLMVVESGLSAGFGGVVLQAQASM